MNKMKSNSFLKGLSLTTLGSIVANLINFVTIMVIIKNINKAEFGLYVLVLAIIHGLRILGGLGLDLTMVRFLSGAQTDEQRNTFWHIMITRFYVSGLIVFLFLLSGDFIFQYFQIELSRFILLIAFLFLLTTFKELLYFVFQGLQLFGKYALVQVFFSSGKLLLAVAMIWSLGLDLPGLLWLEVSALAITLAFIAWMLPFERLKRLPFNKKFMYGVLRFGLPLYLNNILTFVYSRIHIFIIGALMNPVSVALFEVAYKIPEGFSRLFHSFIAVYFPHLSEIFKRKDSAKAAGMINLSLLLVSAISVFIFVFVYLFRFDIVVLLFTPEYRETGDVLFLLMVNFHVLALSFTMGYSLVSAGYSSVPVKVNLVASSISVLANYFFIQKLGYIGAAYAQILMNAVSLLLHWAYLKKYRLNISWFKIETPLFLALMFIAAHHWLNLDNIIFRILSYLGFVLLSFLFSTELRVQTLRLMNEFLRPKLNFTSK